MKIDSNFLKKLQNINIEDFKNIDFSGIKEKLLRRPDLLIIMGVILVTFIGTFQLYTNQKKRTASLQEEILVMQEKLEAVETLKEISKDHNKLLKDFPESVSEQKFTNLLSKFTFDNDVEIISFSPAKKKTYDLANLTKIDLNITSRNYKDTIRFINDIENSPYSIRIEHWSGKMPGGAESETIVSKISISSIEIKK